MTPSLEVTELFLNPLKSVIKKTMKKLEFTSNVFQNIDTKYMYQICKKW